MPMSMICTLLALASTGIFSFMYLTGYSVKSLAGALISTLFLLVISVGYIVGDVYRIDMRTRLPQETRLEVNRCTTNTPCANPTNFCSAELEGVSDDQGWCYSRPGQKLMWSMDGNLCSVDKPCEGNMMTCQNNMCVG